ncbi:MAG: M42 family peptidase [Kiritimatiellae bacterium]|nr:M42 family peptidase [Kiritimatiellia bacterium]
MEKTTFEFISALCTAHTPSGRETPGQKIVADFVRPFADDVRLDAMGNLHVVKNPGAAARIMIDAHCDENGLIVQYIDKDGFLYFSLVGGVNKQLLPGERVVLDGPGGPVNGVIGRKAIHLMSQKEREAGVGELQELWIDIGASDKAEAEEAAPAGTFGVVDSGMRQLLGTRASARAFDDRCGVVAIMDALRLLGGRDIAVAAHFVSATQEELGLLGSKVAAYGIDPALGISVDVTFASDDPKSDPKSVGEIKLGGGPVLGVGPNYDPAFCAFVRDTAKREGIPLQLQPRARGNGTDAFVMRHTRCGVPVVQISIPLRYMHSAVETIDLKDVEDTSRLIAATVAALPPVPQFGFRL